MKKMKLDLVELVVDSFLTTGRSESKGTVKAAEDSMEMTGRVSCYNQCASVTDTYDFANCPEDSPVTEQTYCYQWTCVGTCWNTCADTCGSTCPHFSCFVTPGPGCTC